MRLAALAERLGLPVEGDGEVQVEGAAPLESAGPAELSFVSSRRFESALAGSRAGALIVPADLDPGSRPAIRSANPRYDFARAVESLASEPERVSIMSRNARRTAEKYDWSIVYPLWDALFNTVAASRLRTRHGTRAG